MCLWSVSRTVNCESCSSFHSWSHKAEQALWCQKQRAEAGIQNVTIGVTERTSQADGVFIPAAISLSTACWVETQPWVLWDHRQVVLSAWCLFFPGSYLKIRVSRPLLECVFLPPLCCGWERWKQAFEVKVHTCVWRTHPLDQFACFAHFELFLCLSKWMQKYYSYLNVAC